MWGWPSWRSGVPDETSRGPGGPPRSNAHALASLDIKTGACHKSFKKILITVCQTPRNKSTKFSILQLQYILNLVLLNLRLGTNSHGVCMYTGVPTLLQ